MEDGLAVEDDGVVIAPALLLGARRQPWLLPYAGARGLAWPFHHGTAAAPGRPLSSPAMTRPLPGEFALIARYFAPLAAGFPGAYGLRDDAAVIVPAAGCELVAKTDAILAGVHFLPDDPAALVARKALRVNLSDLAAKGAVPRAYLLDLMLPPDTDEDWVAGFAAGLAEDQAAYGVHLIGGDTDRTPGPLAIAITALGDVPVGRILRRGGARPGDQIWVSGSIGDGALGLRAIRGELAGLDAAETGFLAGRYRLPQPRTALGPGLIGLASAALDVSDGLVADLGHLAEVSGVCARIEAARVPLSPPARQAIAAAPALLAAALTGGDDYEIVLAAPPEAAPALAALSREAAVPLTAIGRLEAPGPAGPGVEVIDAAGRPLALAAAGWNHFAATARGAG
jgi:thiamine-monophosphate kinase